MITTRECKTELTCMSVAPSQRLVAVGGRGLLKLFSLRNHPENDITFLSEEDADANEEDPVAISRNLPTPPPLRSTSSSSLLSTSPYHMPMTAPARFELNLERQLSDKTATDVAMNPSMDNVLAAGSSRRVVELWDLVSCSRRSLLTLDTATITRLSWQVSDPNTLLIGATDGLLRVADVRSENPVHTVMTPRSREIRDCQFNPHDNCTLAACFDNGTVQTYDCRQPKQCARRMIVHDGGALCLQYHPTRRGILATGGGASGATYTQQASYKLKIIAPDREAFLVKSIRGPGVNSLCWRRNTNEIITSLDSKYDHDLVLWNYEDPYYLPLARFDGHSNLVTRVAFLSSQVPMSGANAGGLSGAEDDHILSVGKDGRIVLQRYREMFLPKRGNAFCFGSYSSLLASDDMVMPNKSNKRGKAVVKEFSFPLPSTIRTKTTSADEQFIALSKEYRIGPFEDLQEACEINSQAAARNGNSEVAGFWMTLSCWMTSSDENSSTHGGCASVMDNNTSTPVVSSASSPRPKESNIHPFNKGGSSTSDPSPVNGKGSLLKELGMIDPSMSKVFHVRTKLGSYRQLANDLNALLGEKAAVVETKMDEPHVAIIPSMEHNYLGSEQNPAWRIQEKLSCVSKALDDLVDNRADVQTAVVCVLVFKALDLPLPTTLPKLKRWGLAYCDLLERKCLFPEALEFSQESNKLLNTREDDPESRIGMACGACDEPLRVIGADGDCTSCHTEVSRCAVCRLVVKGLYTTCLKCGHGGHLPHVQQWFAENVECPLGCRCMCSFG